MTQQRKNILLLSGITVVVTAAWLILLLLPLQHSLSEKDDLLLSERIKGEIARLQERNLQATEREYENLRSSSETFANYFLSEKNVLAFIAALEANAQRTSVSQDIENFVAPTGGEKITSFSLKLTGSTDQLLNYLVGVEALDTYVSINKVILSRSASETRNQVQLQLFVTANWL